MTRADSEPREAAEIAVDAADRVDVSIIVVSYNTRELTLACLRSVFAETRGVRCEVLVVDNASADGSAQAIRDELPAVRLWKSTENLGFARAVNLAAREARGEFLLLLNSDTVVLRNAIQRLHAYARSHREAGIYGGRTLFPDGRLNPASCWARATPWSLLCRVTGLAAALPGSPLFNPEGYGGWARDSVRAVDIVQGSFFLTTRALWERLGGFDPVFFMYGEEADFCERARRLGFRPTITPDAEIVHLGGGSERQRGEKLVHLLRAKRTLIDRYWAPPWRAAGRGLLWLLVSSRCLAFRTATRLGVGSASAAAEAWSIAWQRRREWGSAFSPERGGS